MFYRELVKFADTLDRSFFIDTKYKKYADEDSPLPIGHGQTISQPSLVWKMTYMLDLNRDCKVLEIGTGSGYQTVFLAQFARVVYTVERIEEFTDKAKKRLNKLGYTNIHYRVGDGSKGWEEHAPYDRIMVTAAAKKVPMELKEQLAIGGKMVIPVGPKNNQQLQLIKKNKHGKIKIESRDRVRFVELKGDYGWE
ncbi:MAG TPA: protein-L-isoaspartate(D-aspartate) O-methyltransferase [Tepidimicrobium sp.]|nr:protein-L-isoaspartate(D-aspartate) O-methyltransferase [Tepidimicrobium sp.]